MRERESERETQTDRQPYRKTDIQTDSEGAARKGDASARGHTIHNYNLRSNVI